jgi:hypothetical protein
MSKRKKGRTPKGASGSGEPATGPHGSPAQGPGRVGDAGAGPDRADTRFEITHSYRSSALLSAGGPLVPCRWNVPRELAARLAQEHQVVPAPVNGWGLIDTGADRTSIASATASTLRLSAVDVAFSAGAHGRQQSQIYFARFELPLRDDAPGGERTTFSTQLRVLGIRDLEEIFQRTGVQGPDGGPVRVIAVIGRDFLRHARLLYDGPAGRYSIALQFSFDRR